MKKKVAIKTGIGVIVGALLAGGTTLYAQRMFLNKEEKFSQSKLAFINALVGNKYITDASAKEMTEGIYKGYVYGLGDAYTTYLTAEEFVKEQVEADGAYVGTGIEFAWGITNQYLIVTGVIPGSPADEAHIKMGDKITAIDGTKAMMSNEIEIYEKLTYTGQDTVTYMITDNDGQNKREIKLQSRVVEVELLKSELMNNEIGYIQLEGLVDGTTNELRDLMENLKEQGASKWVLDLRGTSSKNIEEVKALCDLFLPEQVAFTVEDKNQEIKEYKTTKEHFEEPVTLITNRYTSGAVEAFVGAIKELHRGQIVGERTAGNGTTQQLIKLDDGSGICITTGVIIGPNKEKIKDNGITPDILERTPTTSTLELVTTGVVQKENDVLLQSAIGSFD